MRNMVKVDDAGTGQPVYIHPDHVCYVYREGNLTFVQLTDGKTFTTVRLTSEVVKAIEDATKQ